MLTGSVKVNIRPHLRKRVNNKVVVTFSLDLGCPSYLYKLSYFYSGSLQVTEWVVATLQVTD